MFYYGPWDSIEKRLAMQAHAREVIECTNLSPHVIKEARQAWHETWGTSGHAAKCLKDWVKPCIPYHHQFWLWADWHFHMGFDPMLCPAWEKWLSVFWPWEEARHFCIKYHDTISRIMESQVHR